MSFHLLRDPAVIECGGKSYASPLLLVHWSKKGHTEAHETLLSYSLQWPRLRLSCLLRFIKMTRRKSEINGFVARRYVGGCDYIGLRERPQEALERAAYLEESASKATHLLLEWHLSSEALAHYVATCAGPEHSFKSVLFKKNYSGTYDWKVWHFLGDLPLRGPGVQYEFKEIL